MLGVLTGPTIAAGEFMSGPIDCSAGELVRITMPADWTPAVLSFALSTDGEGYNDLCDIRGNEILLNVNPGSAVIMPIEVSRAVVFLKLRSGTRDQPVPQEAQREFAVAIKLPTEGASGLIQNWGTVAANANGVTVTFDKPYTELPSVTVADSTTTHSKITSVTLTDFSISGQGDVYWSAVGR